MNHRFVMRRRLLLAPVLSVLALPAWPQPRRDLLVELREVDDAGGGYVVSTQPSRPLMQQQQLLVRNGQKATLRFDQTQPVQWTSAVQAPGTGAGAAGAGVRNEVFWLNAGQAIIVTPHWPGGKQPVTLDLDVQNATLEPRGGGSDLPAQSRSQLATQVTAPLGHWVSIAATGRAPAQGSYSSAPAQSTRRFLQVRVTAD